MPGFSRGGRGEERRRERPALLPRGGGKKGKRYSLSSVRRKAGGKEESMSPPLSWLTQTCLREGGGGRRRKRGGGLFLFPGEGGGREGKNSSYLFTSSPREGRAIAQGTGRNWTEMGKGKKGSCLSFSFPSQGRKRGKEWGHSCSLPQEEGGVGG